MVESITAQNSMRRIEINQEKTNHLLERILLELQHQSEIMQKEAS
jgi:hypothetical protein